MRVGQRFTESPRLWTEPRTTMKRADAFGEKQQWTAS
jgi:hypothetical protein